MPIQYGGSFAPPLTADKLKDYRKLVAKSSPEIKEAIEKLCVMAELFIQTPPSKNGGKPHPSGKGVIVPLETEEIKRIWDHVPWAYECDAFQSLFDTLPSGPKGSPEYDLRNAAFHLLWYAKELTSDREPLTNDRL